MKSKQKTDEPELTGAQVAEYLSANPDFFSDRDSLLALMTLPHQQGGAVSLVERQVSVLRDRNRSTKNHLDDLLNAARRNNEIFDKCQSLILSLLAAKDPITFFDALESGLKHEFDCHAYSLVVFSDDPEQVNHLYEQSIPRQCKGACRRLDKRNKTLSGRTQTFRTGLPVPQCQQQSQVCSGASN